MFIRCFLLLLLSFPSWSMFQFPEPTGQYKAIGLKNFYWQDDNDHNRNLEIKVFYPTETKIPKDRLWYGAKLYDLTTASKNLSPTLIRYAPILQRIKNSTSALRIVNKAVTALTYPIRLNTFNNAPIAENGEKFPVLIFSHGYLSTTDLYMGLIEEIVSHGVILVAIEHTNINLVSRLTDGVHPTVAEGLWDSCLKMGRNISFVVNKVVGLIENKEGEFSQAQNSIVLFGHSLGGGASIFAAHQHDSIKATISLDSGHAEHMLQIREDQKPVLIIYNNSNPYTKIENS